MYDKDIGYLSAILDSIIRINKYTSDIWDGIQLNENELVFDAVLMNFINIGESVTKTSQLLKDDNRHINWTDIKSFRNLVAHDYFGVNAEEVWQIIKNDVPKLETEITQILKSKVKPK